eukprot:3207494-Rhodomonas_salina.1
MDSRRGVRWMYCFSRFAAASTSVTLTCPAMFWRFSVSLQGGKGSVVSHDATAPAAAVYKLQRWGKFRHPNPRPPIPSIDDRSGQEQHRQTRLNGTRRLEVFWHAACVHAAATC